MLEDLGRFSLEVPRGAQIHIHVGAAPIVVPPAPSSGPAADPSYQPRRPRPLTIAAAAVIVFTGGYVLRGYTSPAGPDGAQPALFPANLARSPGADPLQPLEQETMARLRERYEAAARAGAAGARGAAAPPAGAPAPSQPGAVPPAVSAAVQPAPAERPRSPFGLDP